MSNGDTVADGGRIKFILDSHVYILNVDGTVSTETYIIKQDRSDRGGNVQLENSKTHQIVKVQSRRILSLETRDRAIVVDNDNKSWAMCPNDGTTVIVTSNDDTMTCPKCNNIFSTHWIGTRPMDTVMETKKTPTQRTPKMKSTPKKVDFAMLYENCEIWSKIMKFDFGSVDTRAIVIIKENRKLCFNIYNGSAGSKEPQFSDFISGTSSSDKVPWHIIADKPKELAKLTKLGYITGDVVKETLLKLSEPTAHACSEQANAMASTEPVSLEVPQE